MTNINETTHVRIDAGNINGIICNGTFLTRINLPSVRPPNTVNISLAFILLNKGLAGVQYENSP